MEEDLKAAVEIMRKGGIILYPTDTIWGIGCDASNAEAIEKIYRLKRRAESKSMLSLVGSLAQLENTVNDIPDAAYQLIEATDRPLTIIYDHPAGLAPNLLAPDGSAGIRLTEEPFSSALCRRLRRPVVSTSANISGEKAPSSFAEISSEIIEGVDYVVNYGRTNPPVSRSSGIIKVSEGNVIRIIR